MKRKIFSTLLMGAFFIASMSMFTSCKDYDDEIQVNADDIAALKSQLSTLQSALAAAQADAATAHATFLTKSEAASTYATKSALEALQTEMASYVTAAKLQEAIDELTALINGKVDKSEYDAKVLEIETKIDGINSDLNTLKTTLGNVETAYKAADSNLQSQIDAINLLIESLQGENKTFAEKIAALEGADKNFATELATLKSELEALKAGTGDAAAIEELKTLMNEAVNKVNAVAEQINLLTVLVNRKLTSLVLKPAAYYGGIETVEVLSDSATTYKEGKNLTYFTIGGVKTISGIGVAQYHVNPSGADLSGMTVDFFGNTADVNQPVAGLETRSGENVAKPTITSADELVEGGYFKNGILSIPFKANFTLINNNLKNSIGSFIAAQLIKNDTTVTSDYAMVVPANIYDLVISDNTWKSSGYHTDNISTPVNGHLHKKFSELASPDTVATHEVKYNECIDLTAIVETHYTTEAGLVTDSADCTVEDAKCKYMNPSTFEALGLKYVYKTVTYTVGSNKTDETAHIELIEDENGHMIAYPRNVNPDGTTIKGETANVSSVGRMPIILIEVQDAEGTILAYAYMKLLITDLEAAPSYDVTSDPFPLGDLYLDCDGAEGELTWAQVEYYLYNKLLGVSKNTFDATYKFDASKSEEKSYEDGTEWVINTGKQYQLVNGKYVAVADEDTIGVVTEEYNKSESDATTHVLKWAFTADDYEKLVKLGAVENGVNTKAITIYVRYENIKNGGDIYVPLTIEAGKFHFATGSVTNSKILSYWYKYFSATNAPTAEDAFEVRANVPVPTPEDNLLEETEFVKDLHDYFQINSLGVALDDTKNFPQMAAIEFTPEFEFTLPVKDVNESKSATKAGQWTVNGYSGRVYTLQLNDAKNEIQVVKVDGKAVTATAIVTLTANDEGVQSILTYVEGDYADDILNYVGHDKLGHFETFTAYIKMVATGACYDFELNKPFFNVRFLRPLNLTEAKPYSIIDAPNDYQYIPFSSLVGVTDWRDYVGDPANTTGGAQMKVNGNWAFDYAYYQVEFEADTTAILTDITLGADARKNFSTSAAYLDGCVLASTIPGLKLTQEGDSLKYINNSANTGAFHLFVPIKMTYVFGNYDDAAWKSEPKDARQKAYAVITVEKTEGNAKAQ